MTQYKVIAYHGDVALAVNVFHSTATSQFIVGLKNGQAYAFTVSAKNSVGWSAFSARSSAVKVGIPIPPPPPSAAAGVGQATVSWHSPVNNGSAVDCVPGHAVPRRSHAARSRVQVEQDEAAHHGPEARQALPVQGLGAQQDRMERALGGVGHHRGQIASRYRSGDAAASRSAGGPRRCRRGARPSRRSGGVDGVARAGQLAGPVLDASGHLGARRGRGVRGRDGLLARRDPHAPVERPRFWGDPAPGGRDHDAGYVHRLAVRRARTRGAVSGTGFSTGPTEPFGRAEDRGSGSTWSATTSLCGATTRVPGSRMNVTSKASSRCPTARRRPWRTSYRLARPPTRRCSDGRSGPDNSSPASSTAPPAVTGAEGGGRGLHHRHSERGAAAPGVDRRALLRSPCDRDSGPHVPPRCSRRPGLRRAADATCSWWR